MFAFKIFTGWILIDRNGRHFGPILNFLRDGSIPLPETRRELQELLQEAKYYLVQDLVNLVEAALSNLDKSVEPVCKVPLITSHREEQHLISSTQKVFNPPIHTLCKVYWVLQGQQGLRETPLALSSCYCHQIVGDSVLKSLTYNLPVFLLCQCMGSPFPLQSNWFLLVFLLNIYKEETIF